MLARSSRAYIQQCICIVSLANQVVWWDSWPTTCPRNCHKWEKAPSLHACSFHIYTHFILLHIGYMSQVNLNHISSGQREKKRKRGNEKERAGHPLTSFAHEIQGQHVLLLFINFIFFKNQYKENPSARYKLSATSIRRVYINWIF